MCKRFSLFLRHSTPGGGGGGTCAMPAVLRSPPCHLPLLQPPSPLGSDVRGAVRRQIEEAQRLPSMPPFVDYRPLLAELQRWQEELEGAQSDLAAVQQAASEASARSAAQLAAADEGADPEGWHRLNWLRWDDAEVAAACVAAAEACSVCLRLASSPACSPARAAVPHRHLSPACLVAACSQQHPAVAERLQQLGGRIAPAAAAASRALEEVEQLVRSKARASFCLEGCACFADISCVLRCLLACDTADRCAAITGDASLLPAAAAAAGRG